MIKCGFSKKIITPSLGTPCSLGVDNEAEEIFDDIYTRVIALQDKSKVIFLISAEVIALSREDRTDIRNAIAKSINMENFQIIIHTIHNHQAPNVRWYVFSTINKDGYQAISEDYYNYFLKQNAKAAKEALENIVELKSIGYGESEVQGIESNRRIITSDGKIIMRYSRPPENLKKYPEGHIDPKVRCIVLKREKAKSIIWINYHGHPTCTGGDEAPYVTGDFPGWALHLLEKEIPQYEYIYMTGPHGNLNPGKYVTGTERIKDRKHDRDRMGKILAEGIKRALGNAEFNQVYQLKFLKEKLLLKLKSDFPSKEKLEKDYQEGLKEIKEAHRQGRKVTGGGSIRRAQAKRAIYYSLIEGKLPTSVSVLRIGDYYAVFFPSEIFLEASEEIRKIYPKKKILTVSLCSDYIWYIPTPQAYREGGYEVNSSLVDSSSFSALVEAGEELIKNLIKND